MGQELKGFSALTITSSGSAVTNAIGPCGDARALTIIITSSVVGTYFGVQISLLDAAVSSGQQNVPSTFYNLTNAVTSSAPPILLAPASAYTIQFPVFHQLKLVTSGAGLETSGTIVGYALKSITV